MFKHTVHILTSTYIRYMNQLEETTDKVETFAYITDAFQAYCAHTYIHIYVHKSASRDNGGSTSISI
jgi:hypothetical protein